MLAAVLFDLDGTLLDTAPDLVASLNSVRNGEGLSDVAYSEYRKYVSRGARGLIEAGLPAADEPLQAARIERFLGHYEANLWKHTRPYPGVENLLATLEVNGWPWGIVTNKAEYLTWPIVERAGWASRAACVVCGDTAARSKPHPDPLLLACEILKLDPSRVLYVGDDLRDLEAGFAAGTSVGLADWGYGAGEVGAATRRSVHCFADAGELVPLVTAGSME